MAYCCCILKNESQDNHLGWVHACENIQDSIDYKIVDLTLTDWFEKVLKENFDIYLTSPPCRTSHFKQLYDERLYIISKILKKNIYPTFEESIIYENKRMLSYWLEANNIQHPKTFIFYTKKEAKSYIDNVIYPFVGKINIGAAGSGVKIIHTRKEAVKYIDKAFSKKGLKRRFGPNRVTGSPSKWFKKAVKSPEYAFSKVKEYFEIHGDAQRGFVIFQEFIPHEFEWRVVKIGESYFAHKKAKIKDMASGTKEKIYDNPPLNLLNFAKEICEKYNFNSMALDIFVNERGEYLVNELQTVFGQSDTYQMLVNGKPGRYIYKDQQWIFEEGDFNSNKSYDLRLKYVIDLLNNE